MVEVTTYLGFLKSAEPVMAVFAIFPSEEMPAKKQKAAESQWAKPKANMKRNTPVTRKAWEVLATKQGDRQEPG